MIVRLLPLLLCAFLVMGAAEQPQSNTITLSPAEAIKQGRALADEVLSLRYQNTTNTGVLKIRQRKSHYLEIPVKFEIIAGEPSWQMRYETSPTNGAPVKLQIIHTPERPNEYHLSDGADRTLVGNEAMIPFAGSDFWIADLGLEFFHWPGQRLIKKEIRRGQSCDVLESTNPAPKRGAYSRIISWIDIDSDGIIHADAYDSEGRLLKVFEPTEFKKVRGEWQLQEIEIRNNQTGSITKIEFDLGAK